MDIIKSNLQKLPTLEHSYKPKLGLNRNGGPSW